MALNKQYNGTPFNATATHATGAVATQAGVAGSVNYVTDVTVSSDKAGSILLIKQGTTTIWQAQVGATYFTHHFASPLASATGALVSAEIDGTSACKANIAGYTL